MPSGGHDAVMLNYKDSRPEPSVIYVDEDRQPKPIATTFADFIDKLVRAAG